MNIVDTKQKGFTIIEVVLVLAIAALIFLMIFIAWPALQRGQRDTARKNDAAKVASALGSYRSNNSGKQPATATEISDFRNKYVENLSQYDATSASELPIVANGPLTAVTQLNVMRVVTGAKCNSTGGTAIAASSRQAAILYAVETGGSGSTGIPQCQDA